jgi:hypothetical protein
MRRWNGVGYFDFEGNTLMVDVLHASADLRRGWVTQAVMLRRSLVSHRILRFISREGTWAYKQLCD